MKLLLEHLHRMHDKHWIVKSYHMLRDDLIIDFQTHGKVWVFPCSSLERCLEAKISALEAEGFSPACKLIELTDHTVVTLRKTDYYLRRINDSGCPDCKDGYYYPLFGEREPCRECH